MSWETQHRDVGSPTGPLRRSLPATTYHQELFKCYLTQQCACFSYYAFVSKIVHKTSNNSYVETCFLCFAPFLISGFWEKGKSIGKTRRFPMFSFALLLRHPSLSTFSHGASGGIFLCHGRHSTEPDASLTANSDAHCLQRHISERLWLIPPSRMCICIHRI
jgi:hypothetical protein